MFCHRKRRRLSLEQAFQSTTAVQGMGVEPVPLDEEEMEKVKEEEVEEEEMAEKGTKEEEEAEQEEVEEEVEEKGAEEEAEEEEVEEGQVEEGEVEEGQVEEGEVEEGEVEEGEVEEEEEEEELEEEGLEEEDLEEEDLEEEEFEEEELEEEGMEEEEFEEEEFEEEEFEEKEEEEEEEAYSNDDEVSSISSASIKLSLPTFCPSPSSIVQIQGSLDVEWPISGKLSISISPQSSYSSTSCDKLDENSQDEEETFDASQSSTDSKSSGMTLQKQKVTDLVNLLILKYKMKESVTKLEILNVITKDCENQFSIILKKASKCLEMIFGINMKGNLLSTSYVLVNSLDLTFDDVTNDQRMPRNGFLIIVLGVIFIEGNCASEESVWEFLNGMGIYDGEEHFIYGEPREFLTKDLVQQNYLKYQQVPYSQPPRYEFLWGPRAHEETTKMKVLQFMAKITKRDPICFSFLYGQAFRDDEDRMWARMGAMGSTSAMLTAASPTQREEESVSEALF